jgi:hypothetical protein
VAREPKTSSCSAELPEFTSAVLFVFGEIAYQADQKIPLGQPRSEWTTLKWILLDGNYRFWPVVVFPVCTAVSIALAIIGGVKLVRRVDFGPRLYRLQGSLAVMAAGCLSVVLVSTLSWAATLYVQAPDFLTSRDQGVLSTSFLPVFLVAIVVMIEASWLVVTHAPTWSEARRRAPRRKGESEEVWRTFESPLPSAAGYRVIWVHSNAKQTRDAATRAARRDRTRFARGALGQARRTSLSPKERRRRRRCASPRARRDRRHPLLHHPRRRSVTGGLSPSGARATRAYNPLRQGDDQSLLVVHRRSR